MWRQLPEPGLKRLCLTKLLIRKVFFIIDPDPNWQPVFASASRKECADRSLVLQAVDIPFELLQDGERALLVVPAELVERAKHELWEYETENRPRPSAG